MKRFLLLALVVICSGLFAQKPEWERKPIEIIKGHLPKPHYPVVWNLQDNGVADWQIEGDCNRATKNVETILILTL